MIVRRTLLAAALVTPTVTACATAPAPGTMAPLPLDPFTHARPNEARVTHVSLDLVADFSRKVLRGSATLSIVAQPGVNEIVLDVDRLNIRSVRSGRTAATYVIGQHRPDIGAPLTITLVPGARSITIEYETHPEAGALQWLEPSMTASNKPFLFSQGQSILTRTWVPTQDSPGIRQTYDARIVAPRGLKAVMSAEMLTPDGEFADANSDAFRFRMPNPIPPYLIAIAIGDLAFRPIGARTGVYAEPSVVAAAANECADMERMLLAAEALYGPYRWGRYDVLVLPPSFPYGGMENPRLTFLTPTFIAGDRSLVALVAHELAHSWSGNLVTNAVWADSWLNESFTNYFEGRISEALFGVDHVAMQDALAWVDIQAAIAGNPADLTRLHLADSVHPDNTLSAIVYDKGALFLRTLEREVGRQRLDAWLRSYFDRYAFQPMTTATMLADFRARVVQNDGALGARLQLEAWCYEPGLPSNAQEPRAAAFDAVAAQVTAFNAGGPASAVPWADWGTYQRQRFLQTLPRSLPAARLTELEGALGLNATGNSEVLFDWLMLAVANGYEPARASLESFITRQGRRKFVAPLYRALMAQGAWGQAIARRVYATARATYHPVTTGTVDEIVTPR
ncbi:peptidase M1 [alpha proteobacterium U9-1i]|nr:peptidase M1 [alpha proteobacterium U9-1i]